MNHTVNSEQNSNPRAGMTTRVMHGGAWGLGGNVVVMFASLIATPFVIRGLGVEAYGLLALVNATIGYFGFVDFGMGHASTRFASAPYGEGDRQGEVAVIWTALAVVIVPTILAAVVLVLTSGLLAERVLALPVDIRTTAVAAIQIAALGLIGRNVAAVLNTAQLVRFRLDLHTFVNSGTGVGQIVLVPVVIALGGGLIGAVAVSVAVGFLSAGLNGLVSRSLLPGLARPRFSRKLFRPLARYGGGLVVSGLVATALIHAEKIILVRFASVSALAFYAVAFSVAGLLRTVSSALKQSMLPAFAQLHAEEDDAKLQEFYSRMLRVTLLWILPVGFTMCMLGQPFLTVWAGPEYGLRSTGPLYVLVLGFMFNLMAHVPETFLKGVGRTGTIARFHVAELVPYLLLAGLMTFRLGAIGAAIAWSVRVAADAILLFGAARRSGMTFRPVPSHRPEYAVAVASLVGASFLLGVPGFPLPGRIGVGMVAVGTYLVLVWSRVLSREERHWVASSLAAGRKRWAGA